MGQSGTQVVQVTLGIVFCVTIQRPTGNFERPWQTNHASRNRIEALSYAQDEIGHSNSRWRNSCPQLKPINALILVATVKSAAISNIAVPPANSRPNPVRSRLPEPGRRAIPTAVATTVSAKWRLSLQQARLDLAGSVHFRSSVVSLPTLKQAIFFANSEARTQAFSEPDRAARRFRVRQQSFLGGLLQPRLETNSLLRHR